MSFIQNTNIQNFNQLIYHRVLFSDTLLEIIDVLGKLSGNIVDVNNCIKVQNKIAKLSDHVHNIAHISVDVFFCDMAIQAN